MATFTENKHTTQQKTFRAAPMVWGLKTVFVNLYFVAEPDGSWVLIDAGVYGSKTRIKEAANQIFGSDARPKAILLTHGHFDHIGAVKELAEEWDVPVYAHPMELPYLTGRSSYPPPDPSVGGGMMAYMAFMYPKQPINISQYLELLPQDGSVPGLPSWKWVHTPGHTPGHVSFFREEDRTLIAGDAFITRKGESAMAVLTQERKVHGPPMYFTPDWTAAQHSVEKLASLNPEIAATGHGLPMTGTELRSQLDRLVKDFWMVAVPDSGRYVNAPAIADEYGVVSVPPDKSNTVPKALAVAGAVTLAGIALAALSKRNKKNSKIKKQRPYSHNRVMHTTPVDYEDPLANTNNYP